jgi:uncharacterized tellurite resistance protein B-like protein
VEVVLAYSLAVAALRREKGQRRVVEMMWEIAYANGYFTEFESNLIWRAADLLGVSSRERLELGRRVAGERGSETP